MLERILEAGGEGAIAGLIGAIGYLVYYLINKFLAKKQVDKKTET